MGHDKPLRLLVTEVLPAVLAAAAAGLACALGVTALVATHDPSLIDIADSILVLEDGQITAA